MASWLDLQCGRFSWWRFRILKLRHFLKLGAVCLWGRRRSWVWWGGGNKIEKLLLRFAADAARTERGNFYRQLTTVFFLFMLQIAMARQIYQEGYCDSQVVLLSNWEAGRVCCMSLRQLPPSGPPSGLFSNDKHPVRPCEIGSFLVWLWHWFLWCKRLIMPEVVMRLVMRGLGMLGCWLFAFYRARHR